MHGWRKRSADNAKVILARKKLWPAQKEHDYGDDKPDWKRNMLRGSTRAR